MGGAQIRGVGLLAGLTLLLGLLLLCALVVLLYPLAAPPHLCKHLNELACWQSVHKFVRQDDSCSQWVRHFLARQYALVLHGSSSS